MFGHAYFGPSYFGDSYFGAGVVVGTLPGQATDPVPGDSTFNRPITQTLSWTAGAEATSHDVYFGTNPDPSGDFQGNQVGTSFNPGTLSYSETYYWRIDEVNGAGTTTGDVWTFSTEMAPVLPGQASDPDPPDTATNQALTTVLSWTAGSDTDSHNVYLGTSPLLGPSHFRGNQPGTTYDPPSLNYNATYYWRIDEVNTAGVTTGDVWSFTTIPVPSGSPSLGFNPTHRFAVSGDRMTMFPWRK